MAAQILNLQYIIVPEWFAIGGGISAQLVLLKRINWAIQEIKNAQSNFAYGKSTSGHLPFSK